MYRTKLEIIPQFRPDDPVNNLGRLRHLALRLFDFAKWPDTRTAASFFASAPDPNRNHRNPICSSQPTRSIQTSLSYRQNPSTANVYTSTTLYGTLALLASAAVAHPNPAAPASLLKRQGLLWNKDGNECGQYSARACIGINDAGETGYCTITMKTDDGCCINGKCSAQEIGLDRQVLKTTDAYSEESIQDVHFSKACPKGTWIQSELRLV
ncbi:uncharacterized protein PG986_011297 [Apiospora aurea]|uniref:Uncharacterized protein n=1 Tax=Apiospora aurea TaxID=335848 RepID=A0ABR1Q565_9PEZI